MSIAEPAPTTNAEAAELVHAYARSVVAGETVANRYVRLACERHLRDLEEGAKRGLRFDATKAGRAIRFFGYLRLAEGEFDGRPFTLTPSQAFKTGSLFGWLGPDGRRRFRNAYIEEAKGSGKTPWGAGVCLYGMVADGEPAAEILSAAAGRAQATIPWTDARRMVEKSPALASRIEVFAHSLVAGDSSFRAVSSEAKNLHGPRVHIGLLDEEHAHPNSDVVDAIRAGTKGRRQALILRITNSGFDRHSICWADHEYSVKVLEGAQDDDAWFAYVCGLDPCDACRTAGKTSPAEGCSACDDWRDEAVWPKANPNLDVTIGRSYLRELVTEAIGKPAGQNVTKRLNFCIWTEAAERAIALEVWDRNAAPPDRTAGRTAFGGLDLASTTDIAALLLVLPTADGSYDVLGHYFMPAANVGERVRRDGVPYDVWIRDGSLTATPGDITDYAFIRATVHELAERYRISEIAYDRWNASQLVVDLGNDGLAMTKFGQGASPEMAAAVKEFERLYLAGRLRTGGDPVLRWMASNLAWRQDAAGNLFPDRRASADKIDGIVGLLMAIGRAMTAPPPKAIVQPRISFIDY